MHFIGHTEPAHFFNSIDLLIVPSDWDEPFGRVVVESYSHSTPVLVSNRGGLVELVEDNYIIDIDDDLFDQLLDKISGIEKDGYKIKNVSSPFSYSELYNTLTECELDG
ncbi:glycosyltransferase [Psychromonas sp. KJ10-10]|uniref:glycosyltransferase n=1 Tax=Psychromonas sp. KJ10-10 TaxID=3391823 RepID=UPI0039B66C02